MSVKTLRPYQTEALIALWEALHSNKGNVLAVLPTGCGKALVIAEYVRGWLSAYPNHRVLVLTHSRELVEQNHLEMMALWPGCPAGVYSAGLNRRDINAQVLFGSIQSLHRRAFQLQRVDLILVDEAQSIPRSASTTWGRFLSDVKTINHHVKIIGTTATAYRLDSGMLHEGDDALFSQIIYEYDVKDAIEAGYLCEPVSVGATTQIDTSGVGTRAGEFIAGALEAAAMENDTVERVADELVRHGADRRGWIVFGCGIAHCKALQDALRERGISCEGVFADTPSQERTNIIAAYKRQQIRALVSVTALTVGFNAPHTDLVALARPTKSAGLYVQAIGRGLRTFPGKENVLIMDFGSNLARFGPIDAVRVKAAGSKGEGEAPTKKCPSCESLSPISAQECATCGHEFPPQVSKVTIAAATAAVLTSQIKPEWVEVSDVIYSRHRKVDNPDSLLVRYRCGLTEHREWVSLERSGVPRQMACKWWGRRAPGGEVPNTVTEALAIAPGLPKPHAIRLEPDKKNPKYLNVVGAKF